MMQLRRRLVKLLSLPTIGLGVALALDPERGTLAGHIWLLAVLSIALLVLLDVIRTTYPATPSPFAVGLRRRDRVVVARPAGLVRLEREVSMAGSAAFDVHYRLRPTLVDLATGLLSSRRGIDFEREPGRAHEVLGDDLWEIVRPDRPPPLERMGPGIDAERLHRAVSALEHV